MWHHLCIITDNVWMYTNTSIPNTVSKRHVLSFTVTAKVHLSIQNIFVHTLITVYLFVFVQ
jgi:hypothetical protein